MSPPSTVHSELFSGSVTSVDTSQSEETLQQGEKSGTSQTTSVTVNMAARTWSRRSGSSTIPPKGVKLTQQKTPVVRIGCLGYLKPHDKHIFFDYELCYALLLQPPPPPPQLLHAL